MSERSCIGISEVIVRTSEIRAKVFVPNSKASGMASSARVFATDGPIKSRGGGIPEFALTIPACTVIDGREATERKNVRIFVT